MPDTTKVYTMESIADFAATKQSGARLEVDEELFEYFLEVLPPIHMHYHASVRNENNTQWITVHASYGFAEGAELVTAFWGGGNGRYFAQLTREMNPYA